MPPPEIVPLRKRRLDNHLIEVILGIGPPSERAQDETRREGADEVEVHLGDFFRNLAVGRVAAHVDDKRRAARP
jgi:hypothetical protein